MLVLSDQIERDEMMFEAKQYVKTQCLALYAKKSVSVAENTIQAPPAKRNRIQTNFDMVYPDSDDELELENDQSPISMITKEMSQFLSTKYELSQQTDPLKFYKEHQKKYPNLSNLAKFLFCIPASSVASESLFSKAGNIATDARNRLKPKNIETLIMIKENSKYIL